ncbi:MAG TPA: VOC family protein [Candidatus Dormibacteraeota bacterium]
MSTERLGLVLDCTDPVALAPFWAAALEYRFLGAVENYALLVPDGRPGPKLLLQKVPETKSGKNRMHMDIETRDIEGEAARLESLGAQRVSPDTMSEHGSTWILMTDPEGNEFCVCDGGAAGGGG